MAIPEYATQQMPQYYPAYETHSPLGSLAAFKGNSCFSFSMKNRQSFIIIINNEMIRYDMNWPAGDLVYPVLNIGFFIIGVVIVVKVLLALLGLITAKLSGLKATGHGGGGDGAVVLDRKRRSLDPAAEAKADRLESLTKVVMAALDTQQCMQRMTCELGSLVTQYDSAHLLSGIASRMAPQEYSDQVEAFRQAGHCDQYTCGKMVVRKR